MAFLPHPINQALWIMDRWLDLPDDAYKPTVYLFAGKMCPEEVLKAVEIAQAKVPQGGVDGFKYFCGVCHSKIREGRIRLSWNDCPRPKGGSSFPPTRQP